MMLSFTAGNLWAQTAEEINSNVYACLSRFYNQTKGGREIAAMAEGVLVMPGAVKAVPRGEEYGEGAFACPREGRLLLQAHFRIDRIAGRGEAKDILHFCHEG